MIEPTAGRVVNYWPSESDKDRMAVGVKERPLAAHVAFVWNPRMVNVMVIDANGNPYPMTSVLFAQDGDPVPGGGGYCEWMPYQKGQAAKTEALEKKLAGEEETHS